MRLPALSSLLLVALLPLAVQAAMAAIDATASVAPGTIARTVVPEWTASPRVSASRV